MLLGPVLVTSNSLPSGRVRAIEHLGKKNGFVASPGPLDGAGVEEALGHPDPIAGGAGELVGEEVAVLNAKASEDDFALVGLRRRRRCR